MKYKKTSIIILILIAAGAYWAYGKYTSTTGETNYVIGTVEKGTIIVSVSGSGQVSASNQIDIKPKASGDVTYVGVKNGQTVNAGDVIAQLDTRDAVKAVRDAEVALETTKLDLERMKGIMTSSGAIRGNKEKAADDLAKSYDDGFNAVSSSFIDFPGTITGLHDILFTSQTQNLNQWNIDYYADSVKSYDERILDYKNSAQQSYYVARDSYNSDLDLYKNTTRSSSAKEIGNLINNTYETSKKISDAIKNINNLIQFYRDILTNKNLFPISLSLTHISQLAGYTGTVNSHLVSLLTARASIQNNQEALAGTDFDIRDQEIKISQAENSLTEAKQTLADYSIRAPFAGTIAKLGVNAADSVTTGTAVATIITKQKLAGISLNEVDVSKISVGEPVTLTFDAVNGLSISGKVAEIDSIGTVTQGVVTYNVKIGFDTQDERVKSGMSASAAIITDVKQNIISVPNGAITFQNNSNFAEVVDNISGSEPAGNSSVPASLITTISVEVRIGISNDTSTEILSGLNEGDKIVLRKIAATGTQGATQQQAPSLFGGGGGLRGAGGGGR